MEYKKDLLREYIQNSELIVFNENIRVRLSSELAKKYDMGAYDNFLNNTQEYLDMISSLHIVYPGNAHPVLYIYIVPDDNYTELLGIPKKFDFGTCGGKPVTCYDLDGFNNAYGLSQNILENTPSDISSVLRIEEDMHELAHIVHSQFFMVNQTIAEGFAEALVLYGLDFENKFDEHRNLLKILKKEDILSGMELINSESDGSYGVKELLPNRSCSFRASYVSSYLLVRVCIQAVEKNFSLNKLEAIQRFLEIVKSCKNYNGWLLLDIANAIGIPEKGLLYGKDLQMDIINSLAL